MNATCRLVRSLLLIATLACASLMRAESCEIKFGIPGPAPAPVKKASYYSEECRGLPMANGQPFNPDRLTCASWNYPLGTVLEVASGDRRVRVTVTDRGPAKRLVAKGIVIDLTRAAFETLGETQLGHLPISIRVVGGKS